MGRLYRREFLVRGALLAAPALASGHRLAARPRSRGAACPAPVVRTCGADYGSGLRRAVDTAGGVPLLGRPGEHVVVKPTLCWDRGPGRGANVHPDVLRATVELALSGGAASVTVFDRTALPATCAYRRSGAWRALRELDDSRVELVRLAGDDFVSFAPRAEPGEREPRPAAPRPSPPDAAAAGTDDASAAGLGTYRVCRQVLEADRVINLATVRRHPARRASLAAANLLGLIGGWPPSADWSARRDVELALLTAAVRPELTILDATHAVVRNGPLGRGPQDVARWDTLAVSEDPVAVEALGLRLLGLRPETFGHLELAGRLGAGDAALEGGRVIPAGRRTS